MEFLLQLHVVGVFSVINGALELLGVHVVCETGEHFEVGLGDR